MSGRRPIQDTKTMNVLFGAAEKVARGSGASKPGAEHLVVAALYLSDGSARRAFERVGSEPDRLFDVIGGGEPPEVSGPTGPGPFRTQKSAQKVFKKVVKLVRKERSQLLGAYILLVAAADDPATQQALRQAGVDPVVLAAAAREEVDLHNQSF